MSRTITIAATPGTFRVPRQTWVCAWQASKYFWKCMGLGAPWIKWDDMTESLRALYVETGLTELFTETWRTHEKWV
eukprot:8959936-Pyramimonas_sp.AAC.1